MTTGVLIAGLGRTALTRTAAHPGRLAVEAINGAIADAGLRREQVDGLLIACSPAAVPGVRAWMQPNLAREAGLNELRLLTVLDTEGASAAIMIQMAAMAVAAKFVSAVVCVFADAPVATGPSGASFTASREGGSLNTLYTRCGGLGGVSSYAMTAQAYLSRHGLSTDVLGQVAVSNRAWAGLNPEAQLRTPITVDDYHASPPISEPLRMLDCAFPVNGAAAVVVSDRSLVDAAVAPVELAGYGQNHVRHDLAHVICDDLETGARRSGADALRMAGLEVEAVDAFQIYDAFTIMTLLTLEEYGVCEPGQAGTLFESGRTRPGGDTPVSTGGGHTSGGYLQGFTPVVEGLLQVRGEAGERQVGNGPGPTVMVSNVGGIHDHHACLVFRPHAGRA